MLRSLLLLPLIALFWSGPIAAQTPPAPPAQAPPAEPSYPVVTLGVLSYLEYDAELKNRDGFNAFNVTRGYININGRLAENIRFRLTPDLRRATDGSLAGSLVFRLKYGFLQLDEVTPGAWLRLGLHQTPWLDFEESINRYRVQGTMFSEREGIIPGSGDFGIGYQTPLAGDFGELQAGIYNGEGFGNAEINEFKSLQVRLTGRPLPESPIWRGLRLTGYYNLGWYDEDLPRRHGIVMGSFEHPQLVATAQWLAATERPSAALPSDIDRSGYSLFTEVREGLEGWAGFLRFDNFDIDTSIEDTDKRRIIAGVAYWVLWSQVRVGFVFNDEDVRYDAADRLDENRFLAQIHVQF